VSAYTPPAPAKTYTNQSGCPGGTVWLEGQCIKKSQVTSFCGPGYKRQGTKCVSRYPATASQSGSQPKLNCRSNQLLLPSGKCGCPGGQAWNGSACVNLQQANQPQNNIAPAVQVLNGIFNAVQQQQAQKKLKKQQKKATQQTSAVKCPPGQVHSGGSPGYCIPKVTGPTSCPAGQGIIIDGGTGIRRCTACKWVPAGTGGC
jgi:hypothetical protein